MKLLISVAFLLSLNLQAHTIDEQVFVSDKSKLHKVFLEQFKEFTIDHVSEEGFELYGPKGMINFLESHDIEFTLPLLSENITAYPTPEEIDLKIKEIINKCSDIMKIIPVGKSVQNRELYFVKVSDNVHIDEVEPEFKYVANMHGDEIVGRELLVLFLNDLCENRDTHKDFISSKEIFIMPSMNPDGAAKRRRANANRIDLNRNFPDFSTSDNTNTTEKREPETQAIMKFQAKRKFSLSANFHGGAIVVNYPWDTVAQKHPHHDLVLDISKEYAELNPGMLNSSQFPGGVINGHHWYEVNGGMQDWSFYWHNDLQLTIELSTQKWPSYSMVSKYYQDNRDSMINFVKRVEQGAGFYSHKKNWQSGIVKIFTTQNKIFEYPFSGGEFYKVLPQGHYQFEVRNEAKEVFKFSSEVMVNQSKGLYQKI